MADALSRALDQTRSRAHAALRAQAMERANRTSNGLVQLAGHGRFRPAEILRRQGDTQDAATAYAHNHPAAMQGNAPVPAWVQRALFGQLNQAGGGAASGPTGTVRNMAQDAAGQTAMDALRHAFGGGGGGVDQNAPFPVHPGLPPGGQMESPPGFNHLIPQMLPPVTGHLIPLGQGLFIHPETGEIHGFGPHGAVTSLAPPPPSAPPTRPLLPFRAS